MPIAPVHRVRHPITPHPQPHDAEKHERRRRQCDGSNDGRHTPSDAAGSSQFFESWYNAAVFSTPSPLEYARPTRPHRRLFHFFLLPLLWLPAGIGSRIHYGDEFIPFFVAHLPAAPLAWLLESRVEIETLFRIAIAFNFTLMLALGLLMDRLRVPRLACLLLPPLLLAAVLSRFFVFDTIP